MKKPILVGIGIISSLGVAVALMIPKVGVQASGSSGIAQNDPASLQEQQIENDAVRKAASVCLNAWWNRDHGTAMAFMTSEAEKAYGINGDAGADQFMLHINNRGEGTTLALEDVGFVEGSVARFRFRLDKGRQDLFGQYWLYLKKVQTHAGMEWKVSHCVVRPPLFR